MKQHDIDTFDQLFQAQAKLEQNVDLYNTTASLGNPHHLQNVVNLMGGDPRPKLQELNNYIDTCLKSFETRVEKQRSEIAKQRVTLNSLKRETEETIAHNKKVISSVNNAKAQSDLLGVKIQESNKILAQKKLEFKKSIEANEDMVMSMSPKERSFVLQKALVIKATDIIKLMENAELDANFRNGDGISLMQTAIEVGHEGIIDKLKPLVSEESYHPPKKLMAPEIEKLQINEKELDVSNKLAVSQDVPEKEIIKFISKTCLENQEITLSDANLDAEDMNYISNKLPLVSYNLHVVDLSNNQQIGYKGIKYLVNGESGMKAITSGEHEIPIIYQGLLVRSDFCTVRLDLSNCNIGDIGSETIGNALYNGQLKYLKSLNISGNQIGNAGIYSFGNAWNCSESSLLEDLDLSVNNLTDNGAQSFSIAFKNGMLKFLKKLNLFGNKVTEIGEESLQEAINTAPNEDLAITVDQRIIIKNIVDEIVGKINDVTLDNVAEVKDEIKSTGEHHVDTSLFS